MGKHGFEVTALCMKPRVVDETARLGRTLPFRTRNLAKLIDRLRGATKLHTRRRASNVEFRFRVPPEAGPVISQAIESVVVEHEVTRDRALELICADFNAGHGGTK